ncbi:hypothetical protein QAD02_006652 [Eretmocerus hayati]|uniref:Uncharacterized protein n=1 Tax=Eretmocerus hayati TaxID=131215 RepID=A0ACC2N1G8_9HYME|nr:hypothetical protein QAD02_006652 [Eretmocerus hayati]
MVVLLLPAVSPTSFRARKNGARRLSRARLLRLSPYCFFVLRVSHYANNLRDTINGLVMIMSQFSGQTDAPVEAMKDDLTVPLDPEDLKILGEPNAKKDNDSLLHVGVRTLWKNLLESSAAQTLNKEIERSPYRQIKRVGHLAEAQNSTGHALTAVGVAITQLLTNKELDRSNHLEYLGDSGRIFNFLYFTQMSERKNCIKPGLDKNMAYLWENCIPDRLSFGQDLSAKFKEAETVEKSSQALKIPKPKKPDQVNI